MQPLVTQTSTARPEPLSDPVLSHAVLSDQPRVAQPTLVAESVLLEGATVRILDRRVFPFERTWVVCRTVEDVARAIEDMVTQSSGPWFAAAGGMALAARAADAEGSTIAERRVAIHAYAERLKATRRTNNQIREVVGMLLATAEEALDRGSDLTPSLEAAAIAAAEFYAERSRQLGAHAAVLIPDGATILTHCWAESYLTETVAAVLQSGKTIQAICAETRPYMQGARLTAESLAEMGVPTRLITDGMPAHLMARGDIDLFISAADRVTMDGHVVNKIGTFQIALAAHALGIPYFALVHAPDRQARVIDDVEMEERNGDEVLHVLGRRTASERVTGIYPAFDATPPRYVGAVVTDRGRFSPYDLDSYYREQQR
jgi:Predicted translation initiation factor 2B subunit, eIF-2B alpha/beta/delta family